VPGQSLSSNSTLGASHYSQPMHSNALAAMPGQNLSSYLTSVAPQYSQPSNPPDEILSSGDGPFYDQCMNCKDKRKDKYSLVPCCSRCRQRKKPSQGPGAEVCTNCGELRANELFVYKHRTNSYTQTCKTCVAITTDRSREIRREKKMEREQTSGGKVN
jgi:hypothetical protein